MKPKDLKAAFSWEERHPLIHDRVFHVPNYYDKHEEFTFPGWESKQFFGNHHPVCIEYCTGNGAWIANQAKRFSDKNWIGVELRYDRVRKIWSKIKNDGLSNLMAVCAEGWTFTHFYVPEQSVEEIFINFPDPWPKEKHEKHRLMKSRFLDELGRILKSGCRVNFVSDDDSYVQITVELFKSHPLFTEAYVHKTEFPDYGTSWFESLWRRKGKQINYLQFFRS